MRLLQRFLLVVCAFTLMQVVSAADFKVLALFPGKAMLEVNGKNLLLHAGKEKQGYTLVSTDTYEQKAVIIINGSEDSYSLGSHIGGGYAQPSVKEVRLVSNGHGSYLSGGLINNQSVNFLVDTGASNVAMSQSIAASLGIDFEKAQKVVAFTAAGQKEAWRVKLDSVAIGGITLRNVDGMVVSGEGPPVILLGMSFLKQLEISQQDNLMVLRHNF